MMRWSRLATVWGCAGVQERAALAIATEVKRLEYERAARGNRCLCNWTVHVNGVPNLCVFRRDFDACWALQ